MFEEAPLKRKIEVIDDKLPKFLADKIMNSSSYIMNKPPYRKRQPSVFQNAILRPDTSYLQES